MQIEMCGRWNRKGKSIDMYEYNSRIRYSETDSEGRLTLEGLLNYFQDGSTFQSEVLGVGIDYLKQDHLAWVLSSWQIVVKRYPELCEEVVIGTFPYDFKGCLGSRNFYMKGKDGDMIAKANSLWTLVDLDKMFPKKPDPDMIEKYVLEPKLDMEYAPRKIIIPDGGSMQEPVIVRKSHLDTNHHVNNGQYIKIAMDFLPDGYIIRQLRAEYKKQALLRDTLYPYIVQENDIYVMSLQDAEGKPYVNVEFS